MRGRGSRSFGRRRPPLGSRVGRSTALTRLLGRSSRPGSAAGPRERELPSRSESPGRRGGRPTELWLSAAIACAVRGWLPLQQPQSSSSTGNAPVHPAGRAVPLLLEASPRSRSAGHPFRATPGGTTDEPDIGRPGTAVRGTLRVGGLVIRVGRPVSGRVADMKKGPGGIHRGPSGRAALSRAAPAGVRRPRGGLRLPAGRTW